MNHTIYRASEVDRFSPPAPAERPKNNDLLAQEFTKKAPAVVQGRGQLGDIAPASGTPWHPAVMRAAIDLS